MKKDLSLIILVIVFLVGLSLMLYPSLADYWNQRRQSRAISSYEDILQEVDDDAYTELFAQADDYNARLRDLANPFAMYNMIDGYNSILNISGNGVIGYITIDKISVELPIYHGISDAVLSTAVGHFEGTSLPVGGKSTHSVLSAHRGLPRAKLFTDLGKLEIGDSFVITVLDRVITYEVDQIVIVKPNDATELAMVNDMDYCTLLTCTPYGINSHRLLVRGTRVENAVKKTRFYISNEAHLINPMIVTPAVATPMLVVLLIILLVKYRPKKKQ